MAAGGKAVVSILDVQGAPRIELTSTQSITARTDNAQGVPAGRHLPDEIRQLADDVRRGLVAFREQVKAARHIDIEIQMRGRRPDIEFIFRCRQP